MLNFWKKTLSLGCFFVLAVSLAGLSPSPALSQDRPDSFAPLVKKVSPAVVNIRTEKTVEGPGGFYPSPGRGPGEGNEQPPDLHEFFRRFFGGPGAPGQQGPPRAYKQRAAGSGVLVDTAGYVLTNNHVVAGADKIVVRLKDGDEHEAQIIGRDKKTDLALIKIKTAKQLPSLPLGDSDKLQVGDWVLAMGNPFGLENTVTAGIVSAKGRVIGAGPYDDFIQTDASINPGNSGGPLINLKGEVVGINTAIVAQGQGIGFAIPVNMARKVMEQLRAKGRVVRGWLGVMIQPITPELAKKFDLKDTQGALVADVVKSGPADKAGVKRGDVIVEFNGQPIRDFHTLSRLAAESAVGSEAKLTVVRKGRSRPLTVTIGEMKAEEVAEKEGPVEKVQLGMELQELTPDLAQQLGMPGKKGLVVTAVVPGGPAAEAGVMRGDVILEAAQKPVSTPRDFEDIAGNLKPGEGLLLLIQRKEGTIFVVVKAPKK
jgi:serine protease Do